MIDGGPIILCCESLQNIVHKNRDSHHLFTQVSIVSWQHAPITNNQRQSTDDQHQRQQSVHLLFQKQQIFESPIRNFLHNLWYNQIAIQYKEDIHTKISAFAPSSMIKHHCHNGQSFQQIYIMTVIHSHHMLTENI